MCRDLPAFGIPQESRHTVPLPHSGEQPAGAWAAPQVWRLVGAFLRNVEGAPGAAISPFARCVCRPRHLSCLPALISCGLSVPTPSR